VTQALTERHPLRRRPGALATVAITLLILGSGFAVFGFTPALLATLYVGLVAAYIAIPYTVLAVIAREVNAWWSRRDGQLRRDDQPELSGDAIRFGMFRQRASLTTAIAMLVTLAVFVAGLLGGWGDQPNTAPGPPGEGDLLAFGAFAVVSGVLAIVVNGPSIYSRLVIGSERHAIRQRLGAWKLILANTILTTASWIAYCGFAVYFLTQSM
jgi:hypothetical protein